jgi:hypothetical protein
MNLGSIKETSVGLRRVPKSVGEGPVGSECRPNGFVGGGLRSAGIVDAGGTSRLLSQKTRGLLDFALVVPEPGKSRRASRGCVIAGQSDQVTRFDLEIVLYLPEKYFRFIPALQMKKPHATHCCIMLYEVERRRIELPPSTWRMSGLKL